MKDEKELLKLNNENSYSDDALTPLEIAEVEALYEKALEADVPDIWDRIVAGLDSEGAGDITDEKSEHVSAGQKEEEKPDGKKVVSLIDRKRRRKTYISVMAAAAAVILILIPTYLYGLNKHPKTKDNASSQNVGNMDVDGMDKQGENKEVSGAPIPENEYVSEMPDSEKYDYDDTSINSVSAAGTETGMVVATETVVDDYGIKVKPGEVLKEITAEGYLYMKDDKLFFETDSKEIFEVDAPMSFDKKVLDILKNGKKVKIKVVNGLREEGSIRIINYELIDKE